MIDESDFKLWSESRVTKLLFKFLKTGDQGIEDIEKHLIGYRDFRMDAFTKESYLKGIKDGYERCLNINLDDLKSVEEEEKI